MSGVVVAGLAAWTQLRPAPGLPPGPWAIGLDTPLTGGLVDEAAPVGEAVMLAVDEVNDAGGIGGVKLTLDQRDSGGGPNGGSPQRGAENVSTLVADPRTVAIIGPLEIGGRRFGDSDHKCGRPPAVQPNEYVSPAHQATTRGARSSQGIIPTGSTTSAPPQRTTSRARPSPRSSSTTCTFRGRSWLMTRRTTSYGGLRSQDRGLVHRRLCEAGWHRRAAGPQPGRRPGVRARPPVRRDGSTRGRRLRWLRRDWPPRCGRR